MPCRVRTSAWTFLGAISETGKPARQREKIRVGSVRVSEPFTRPAGVLPNLVTFAQDLDEILRGHSGFEHVLVGGLRAGAGDQAADLNRVAVAEAAGPA